MPILYLAEVSGFKPDVNWGLFTQDLTAAGHINKMTYKGGKCFIPLATDGALAALENAVHRYNYHAIIHPPQI